MYLLDTNVISELRKAKSGKANSNVIEWAQSISLTNFFVSVITILELEIGILQRERKDKKQGQILRKWLNDSVLPTFNERILSLDVDVAQVCAKLHIPNPKSERDAIIAATALVHNMTIVTRNTKDFAKTDVRLLNPWK
ncbi:MAG: type II toxin-antitoxin system VapC family toxin [Gammaproteobacteria bacterium]|nr:MAG: type II toxin-antitoxin system VapC family toxin [Gammaproteobacteria bacterium]UTW42239.1 type II toxin-antitoxin system VapC family toxin [bacterium SCSIO 12844]